MSSPLLSVVIPTWNRAHIICEAVDSALAQSAGRVEVIVVDDGSTDNTAGVLTRRFGSRIRLLRMPQRRGVGAARNAGVRVASGELLAFLDSDDIWLPGKLDAELRVFERFPDAEVVVSDSLNFLEGQADEHSRFGLNGLLAASQGQVRRARECRWLWTNSENGAAIVSITLRRSASARVGEPLFAEDIACCEDWEFQMRLYHLCRVVVLPEVWARVRRYDDGTRPGRAVPGTHRNREQDTGLLRDRLTVMERSQWPGGLEDYLADELERFRGDIARRLARVAESEQ